MSLIVITPPALEPVSLTEAKLHLRVDHSDEDDLISALITAARETCEVFTNRAFITQTLSLKLDKFPLSSCDNPYGRIWIPRAPFQSIDSFTYYAADGTLTTLVHSTACQTDTSGVQGSVYPAVNTVWPATQAGKINAVIIQFLAGYGATAASVPASIRAAMKLLIGHLYENREAVVVGTTANELPLAVENLLWNHRIINFAEAA